MLEPTVCLIVLLLSLYFEYTLLVVFLVWLMVVCVWFVFVIVYFVVYFWLSLGLMLLSCGLGILLFLVLCWVVVDIVWWWLDLIV